jgi:hypothetical protein
MEAVSQDVTFILSQGSSCREKHTECTTDQSLHPPRPLREGAPFDRPPEEGLDGAVDGLDGALEGLLG